MEYVANQKLIYHRLSMRLAYAHLSAALFVSLLSSSALAQRAVDVSRFHASLDADGFLALQGTRTPAPGKWTFAVFTHYERSVIELSGESGTQELLSDRLFADLSAEVGLTGRVGIALAVPYLVWQEGDDDVFEVNEIERHGFGNAALTARFRLLGESSAIERERHEGPGLALSTTAWVPVGEKRALFAEDHFRLGAEITGTFHVLGFGAGASLGYRHRFEDVEFAGATLGSELHAGLALQGPTIVLPNVLALVEFRFVTDAAHPFSDSALTSVQGDIGFRWALQRFALTLLAGTSFADAIGAPAFHTSVGVSWIPGISDSDGDGLEDSADQCVHLAEDLDGFEDSDGCLDPDNDNDLIPDPDDQCPDVAAEEGMDEDENGCTD